MFTRKASKQLHSLLLEPNSQVIPLWVQRSTTYLKLPTLYCKQRATSTKKDPKRDPHLENYPGALMNIGEKAGALWDPELFCQG